MVSTIGGAGLGLPDDHPLWQSLIPRDPNAPEPSWDKIGNWTEEDCPEREYHPNYRGGCVACGHTPPSPNPHGLPDGYLDDSAIEGEQWWVSHSSHIRYMLQRAQAGEDIGLIMAEEYANGRSWRPGQYDED